MTRSEQWINIKEISNRGGGERERGGLEERKMDRKEYKRRI